MEVVYPIKTCYRGVADITWVSTPVAATPLASIIATTTTSRRNNTAPPTVTLSLRPRQPVTTPTTTASTDKARRRQTASAGDLNPSTGSELLSGRVSPTLNTQHQVIPAVLADNHPQWSEGLQRTIPRSKTASRPPTPPPSRSSKENSDAENGYTPPKTAEELLFMFTRRIMERFDDHHRYKHCRGDPYLHGYRMAGRIKLAVLKTLCSLPAVARTLTRDFTSPENMVKRLETRKQLIAYLDCCIVHGLNTITGLDAIWRNTSSEDDAACERETKDGRDIERTGEPAAQAGNNVATESSSTGQKRKRLPSPNITCDQQPSKKRKICGRGTYPDDSKISQTDVKEWYGNRCTLTGQRPGEPVPVFTVGLEMSKYEIDEFWVRLYYFSRVFEEWDIMAAKHLLYSGNNNAKRNILPLGPHVRRAWDAHLFALRPVQHHDSQNRMFLQTDFHIVRDLRTGERMEVEAGDQNTFVTDSGETIETGSLFELVTADKDEFPLPSFDILSLAYDIQILFASMSSAGMAREVFSGQPPDVEPVPPTAASDLTALNALVLRSAVEKGVLAQDAADRWRAVLLKLDRAEAKRDSVQWWTRRRKTRELIRRQRRFPNFGCFRPR